MGDAVLQQDLGKKAENSGVYMINLLFKERVETPSAHILRDKIAEKFGGVDIVAANAKLSTFALLDHTIAYEGGKNVPSQILITDCDAPKKPLADDLARTQFWDVENGAELLDSLPYTIMIGDFLARGLEPIERANILADWLDIALDIFPSCEAVYFQPSAKLLTADQLRNNPYADREKTRFLYGGMNIRFFNIQGSNAKLVDTLGLYAFGLPEVQYHFHTLNTDDIVRRAFNTAVYQFENDAPIKSGDTIEGVSEGEKWLCQYEDALIQPAREVLDIEAGKFAAGDRSQE